MYFQKKKVEYILKKESCVEQCIYGNTPYAVVLRIYGDVRCKQKKKMNKRKPIEFGINMNLYGAVLAQQQDLDDEIIKEYFTAQDPCHIYVICKRPKIFIDPDSLKIYDEFYSITFKIQRGFNFEELNLTGQHPFEDEDEIEFYTEFPHNHFTMVGKKSGIKFGGRAASLIQAAAQKIDFEDDFLDLEVLYVGQSYGVDGARTAPDRLKSHSTLQNIYSEAINRNIDSDIWILLASFEQITYMMMHSDNPTTEEEMEKDWKDRSGKVFDKIQNDDFSEQQKINFTEAALIRYFEPKYNKEYKDTFPNPAHKTYQECYELDINSILVELGTYDILKCRLFSDKVPSKNRHFAQFNLHSSKERKGMFEF